MSDLERYLLVGLIVFFTHFQEGVTGFGCTVLALPFVALLLGLKVAVPMLVMLAWILSLFIVIAARKRIVWREYLRIIALAAPGLPVGLWVAHVLPEEGLKWVLAFFMVGIGVNGLIRQIAKSGEDGEISPRAKLLLSAFIPIGGVIQGAFGSGGPLVVVYASRLLTDKSVFRVTLCLVWLTLNGTLITQWAVRSMITAETLRLAALCLPFTITGMLLGNLAHHRIDETAFRILVYSVLIASGGMLVWSLI